MARISADIYSTVSIYIYELYESDPYSAGFVRQKRKEDAPFCLIKCGIFFPLFCLTNFKTDFVKINYHSNKKWRRATKKK
jgi:hypothetical protein